MPRSAARGVRWPRRMPPPPTRPPLRPIAPRASPLWPFILAAALVVVVLGSIAFVRRSRPPELEISARVSGTPTPTPQRADAAGGRAVATTFLGSGSWTMSALPTCFHERDRLRGPLADLRSKFPPPGERVRPGSVIRLGDCTIAVGAHDIEIARGNDRLRVPPEAALYREGAGLTLVFVDGARAEIRRY